MDYYVTTNDKGVPTNFYHSDENSIVVSEDVPQNAIKINREIYDKLGSGKFALLNNKLVSYTPPPNYISTVDVDYERDKRLKDKFTYKEKQIQIDDKSILNILCNAQIAQMAISNGIKPNDLKWKDSSDFSWICTDNTIMYMDAYTFMDFFKSLTQYRSKIIQNGRNIKDKLAKKEVLNINDNNNW